MHVASAAVVLIDSVHLSKRRCHVRMKRVSTIGLSLAFFDSWFRSLVEHTLDVTFTVTLTAITSQLLWRFQSLHQFQWPKWLQRR